MTPIQVLAYVYAQHSSLWKLKLSHAKLIEILELSCAPSRISEAFQDPDRATRLIVSALENPAKQAIIAQKLGFPAIFDCDSEEALSEILPQEAMALRGKVSTKLQVFTCDDKGLDIEDLDLSDVEREALEKLQTAIVTTDERLVMWSANRFTGANFITSLLRPNAIGQRYKRIVVIRPATFEGAFEPEIDALRELLGLSPVQMRNGQRLAECLDEQNTLIVVKHAEYLPPIQAKQGMNPLVNLIRDCGIRRGRFRYPQVVVVGNIRLRTRPLSAYEFSNECPEISLQKTSAYPFYLKQLQRFHTKRGYPKEYDEGGFRPKRARWHFEGERLHSSAFNPIDIRVRAFFASDPKNYGYFDCTQGFEKLCGAAHFSSLPIDIEEYLIAGRLYIASLSHGSRNSELQVLRWISTGIYWVSQPAIDLLRKRSDRLGATISITEDSFWSCISALDEVIRQVSYRSSDDKELLLFVAPMGLKAIVQDHWRKTAPFDRSVAHYKIAERLFSHQNNKEALQYEFPFQPHWGRTRHFFIAETIRHLVRATEGERLNAKFELQREGEFPGPPKRGGTFSGTADPFHALQYCYKMLFRSELNGNSKTSRARKLSTRHGAYHMTAELLQLFAEHNDLSAPHNALPEEVSKNFFDDVGFAKLDLGELEDAKKSFEKSLKLSEELNDHKGQLKSFMDLALVCTIKGRKIDLADAESFIRDAELLSDEQNISSTEEDIIKKRNSRAHIKTRDRIKSRKAHIMYLEGKNVDAREIYSHLEKSSLKRDIAHSYIAALMSSQESIHRDLATQICAKNIFENTSKAQHHEALGFRVALAHIFRKINMIGAAEECLDLVKSDISDFGCSERTYQAFLLEAGRNLLDQEDREVRAYVMYLRPCFTRSFERGFFRVARQSRVYCLKAINRIENLLFVQKVMKPKQYILEAVKPKIMYKQVLPQSRGEYLIDPLASYQETEAPSELINRLMHKQGLQEERDWLTGADLD